MDGSLFSPVVELRRIFEGLPGFLRTPIEMVVFGGELPRADISELRRMAAELRTRSAELHDHSAELETLLTQEDSIGETAEKLRAALRSYKEGAERLGGDVDALSDQAQGAANDAEKWLCVMFTFGIHLAWRIFAMMSTATAAGGPAGSVAAAPAVDAMLIEGRAEVAVMRAGLLRAIEAGAAKMAARLTGMGPLQFVTMVGKAAALPVGVDAGVQAMQVATGDRTADIMGSDGTNPTGVDLTSIGVAALAGVGGATGGMLAGRFAPMVFPKVGGSRLAMGLVHGTAGGVSGLAAASLVAGWPQHYDQVLAPLLNGAFSGGVYARGGARPAAVDGGGAFTPPDRIAVGADAEFAGPVRPPVTMSAESVRTWESAKKAWTATAEPGGERGAVPGDTARPAGPGIITAPDNIAVRPAPEARPPGTPRPVAAVDDTGGRRAPVSEGSARPAGSDTPARSAVRSEAGVSAEPAQPKPAASDKVSAPRRVEAVGETSAPPKVSTSTPARPVVEAPETTAVRGDHRPSAKTEPTPDGEHAPPANIREVSAEPPAGSGAEKLAVTSGEHPPSGSRERPGSEEAQTPTGQRETATDRSGQDSPDGPLRTADGETQAGNDRSQSAHESAQKVPPGDQETAPGETGPPRSDRERAVDLLIDFHAGSGKDVPEHLRLNNLPDDVVLAGLHDPDPHRSLLATMEIIRRRSVSDAVPGGMVLRVEQAEAVYAMAGRPVEMKPGEGKSLVFQAAAIQRAVRNGSVLLVTTTDGLAAREVVKFRQMVSDFGIDVFRADQQRGFGPITEGRPAIVVATGETVGHLTNAGHRPPRSVLIDEIDGIIDRGERQFLRSEGAEQPAPEETAREVFAAHDFLTEALATGKLSHEDFGLTRITEEIGVRPDGSPEHVYWYDGQPELTPGGRAKVEALPGGENWLDGMGASRLEVAAQAEFLVREGVHYDMDAGKIVIIDQAEHGLQRNPKTSSESRWSAEPGRASLAQAIEAKQIRAADARGESTEQHRIVVRADAETVKRIDAVEIYRAGGKFFDEVTGASGTLADLNPVLKKIYGLEEAHEVGRSQTHRLVEGQADVVQSTRAKLEAIARYAREMRAGGEGRFQEILCHRNDLVARQVEALVRAGVPRDAIEAVDAKRIIGWGGDWEAQLQKVFDEAGEKGKILVINRQGQRGVDISVSEEVAAQGGMHVWMTEAPEQSYIHEQAKNRTARNGARGSAQVLLSPQDALIRNAMHLQGVRDAVVHYQEAVAAHTADPSPRNHQAVVEASNAVRELTPELQQRALRHSTADFIRHHANSTYLPALTLAEAETGNYADDVDFGRPDRPADRTARLAGLLGIPAPALESHLTALERTGAIDPMGELLHRAGIPDVAAEALRQHVEATAPATTLHRAIATDEQALDQLTPLRNLLAGRLGLSVAQVEGAEGLRTVDPLVTEARDNLAKALGYPPAGITPTIARDILGEAVGGHLTTEHLAAGADSVTAARKSEDTAANFGTTDSAVVDSAAATPDAGGAAAQSRNVDGRAAEEVLTAASQYLALSALLDSVMHIHRRSPNSCVNNAVTGMRVLWPDKAGRFAMPAATLEGHGRDVVRQIFGAGLERSASLDEVAESLKARPGGATVLVYKWKDSRAAGRTDADDHMVLLVNDSTSVDDPNLVVVDLAAARDSDTADDYGPKDLRNRRALLNKAVGFDGWRSKQETFINQLPAHRRLFETIEFDRDGNLATGARPDVPVAETRPPSPRPLVSVSTVDEIESSFAAHPDLVEQMRARAFPGVEAPNRDVRVGSRPHEPAPGTAAPATQDEHGGRPFRVLDDPGMSGDREVEPGYWGHYGAAGVLVRHVNQAGEERFLIAESKGGYSQGNWQLPGGALYSRETPAQGAAREMSEELGVSADYLAGLEHRGTHVIDGPRGWKYHVLVADAPRLFDPAVDNVETAQARWVSRDELLDIAAHGELHSALTRNLPRVLGLFEPDADAPEVAEPEAAPVAGSTPVTAERPPGFRPEPAFRTLDRAMFEEYLELYAFGRASFGDPTRTAEVARRNEEFFARYPQARTSAVMGQLNQYRAVGEVIEKLARNRGVQTTEMRAHLKRELTELVEGKPLGIRINEESLFGLLADGRFKTQFEGTLGGGHISNVARLENQWFGNPEDMDPRLRPVYAHVLIGGERPAGLSDASVSAGGAYSKQALRTEALAMYGRIELVLTDVARARATMCVGDSLVNSGSLWGGRPARTIPSLLHDPQPESFYIGLLSDNLRIEDRVLSGTERDYLGPDFRRHQFVEAQIHGGLTLADIDHINLPEEPGPELRAALDRAGVPWRVLNSHTIARSGDSEAIERERRRLEEDLAMVDEVIGDIRGALEFFERGDKPAHREGAELRRVELRNAEAMRDRIVEMLAPLEPGPADTIGRRPSESAPSSPAPNTRTQYTVRASGAAWGPSGREGEAARTGQVREERHRVERLLNESFGWLDSDGVDIAVLLMSELIANSLADTDGEVEVVITWTDTEAGRVLRFEVRDESTFVPEIGDMPDEFAERGRGLPMLAAAADASGITVFEDGSGKASWFELHRPVPPGAPADTGTEGRIGRAPHSTTLARAQRGEATAFRELREQYGEQTFRRVIGLLTGGAPLPAHEAGVRIRRLAQYINGVVFRVAETRRWPVAPGEVPGTWILDVAQHAVRAYSALTADQRQTIVSTTASPGHDPTPLQRAALETFVRSVHNRLPINRTPSSDEHSGAVTTAEHNLTEHELELIRMVAAGLSNDDIATRLDRSASRVKFYLKQIGDKLGDHGRLGILSAARDLGLLSDDEIAVPLDRSQNFALTAREISILTMVADGMSNKDVAVETGLSPLTVKAHLARIGGKLGISDRAGMVARGIRAGLVPPTEGGPDFELSEADKELLGLVAEGMSNKEIAVLIALSPSGVKQRLDRIGAELGIRDRAGMVGRALRTGGLTIPPVGANSQPIMFRGAGALSAAEVAILVLVKQGRTNEQIAAIQGISPATVNAYLTRIGSKLRTSSRAAAVAEAERRGIDLTSAAAGLEGVRAALAERLLGPLVSDSRTSSTQVTGDRARDERSVLAVLDHLAGTESDAVVAARNDGLGATVIEAVRGLDPADLDSLLIEHGVERAVVDDTVARFARIQIQGAIPSAAPTTTPDIGDYLVHLTAADGSDVGQTRRLVRRVMANWAGADGLGWPDPDHIDSAELLVSELAGNISRHAGTRGFVIATVTDRLGTPVIRVGIRDYSHVLPSWRNTTEADADDNAESGRGGPIMDMLATDYGVVEHIDGKTVWFEIRGERPVDESDGGEVDLDSLSELFPDLDDDAPDPLSDPEGSNGQDDPIGSKPAENEANPPESDPIGARPADTRPAFERYRHRLDQQYRDLAERFGVVARGPQSTAVRPEWRPVLDRVLDSSRAPSDADRLVRLAWRLQCLDELAGREWAEARDRPAPGEVAGGRQVSAQRLEPLTAALIAHDDAANAVDTESATLTAQLDAELAQLFGPPPGALAASIPHDDATVRDIEGLAVRSTSDDLSMYRNALVRHVDATGVDRYLMVREPPHSSGMPSDWRFPTVAEAVALNVRATGPAEFTDTGIAVVEAAVRFAAGIGDGRITDARWLTTNELEIESTRARLHSWFEETFPAARDIYDEVPPPRDAADRIARSASRLSLGTEAIERLARTLTTRPESEQDEITELFEDLVELVETIGMDDASATIGDTALLDRLRKQQICLTLAAHPAILDALSTPIGYEVVLDFLRTPDWSIGELHARVGLLGRPEIRAALQQIDAGNPHTAPLVRSSLGQPRVNDLEALGQELCRLAEVPAGVLNRRLLDTIRRLVAQPVNSNTSRTNDQRSAVMTSDYRIWSYLAALDDLSPSVIRQRVADDCLRTGRLGDFPKELLGAVVFTEQQLREVEDLYIDRANPVVFSRYFALAAALSPSHRPPTIRAAMELGDEVTLDRARSVRAIMSDEPGGERAVLGVRGTGAAVLPELKAVVRSFVTELMGTRLSPENSAKVQASDLLAGVMSDVTRFSDSEWHRGDTTELRALLAYHDRAATAGRIAAMPEQYLPSGVVEVAKLRTGSGPEWTEDLLARYARLAANLRAARAAMTGERRPITHLLEELGHAVVEHISTLERSLESGRLANGTPINEVARRKMEARVAELRRLVATEPGSANPFPALRSLADFENNFQLLSRIGAVHDHLRTICFAWAMQKYPEWVDRLRDIAAEEPTLDEIVLVREFVEHMTNQEVFAQYFSDRKAARTFRRMTSAIALDEAIARAQGVGVARETTPLRFIPTRGPLLELSGHIASACWAGEYRSIAEEMPNMTAAVIVRNPEDPALARFEGAGLLIETTSGSGVPLLLVRGLNPLETYINHVSVEDFYRQFIGWAQGIAAARGRQLAIVIDGSSGEAATNRPALFQYLNDIRPTLTPVQVDPADTTFNGYNVSRTAYLVAPAADTGQSKSPQPGDRIGSRPTEEPGSPDQTLRSLSEPEAVLGWVRSALSDADGRKADRRLLIDRLREHAVVAHPDTGLRPPDGWTADNRQLRRDHAAKAREIADRLESDPAYGPAEAQHDARSHAAEMRAEHSGFRWQLVVSGAVVADPAALAAAVAARLPEEDGAPTHRDIIAAAERLAELTGPVVGEDAALVVTSSRDPDGRHHLITEVDYTRPDPTDADPGLTLEEVRRGRSAVDGRIDLDTAEPLPEGQVRHRLRIDLTRQRILVCCGRWGRGTTGMETLNLALCEGLIAAGHEVTVLPYSVDPYFRMPGARVVVTDDEMGGRYPEYVAGFPDSVDMVIVHDEDDGVQFALNAEARYPAARIVAVQHLLPMLRDSLLGFTEGGRSKVAAGIYLARRAHLIAGLGPALATDALVQATLAGHSAVHELQPALAVEEQPPEPAPGSPVRVLLFGRVDDALKGGAEIAEVVSQLRGQGHDVRLTVRGFSGDLTAAHTRLATLVGDPDAVEVFPHTTDTAEIRADIRSATMVVMPSRAEGFGTVVTEAIEHGVPVVVPSTSGAGRYLAALDGNRDAVQRFNLVPQDQGAPVPIDEWVAKLSEIIADIPGAWAAARRLQELMRPLTRENSARMLVHATVNTETHAPASPSLSRTMVSVVDGRIVARGEDEDYLRILAVADAMETDFLLRDMVITGTDIEFAPSWEPLAMRFATADADEWSFTPSTTPLQREQVRAHILRATVATAAERGFAATTVDEICRRAAVDPAEFRAEFQHPYQAFVAAHEWALQDLWELSLDEVMIARPPDRTATAATVANVYATALAARPLTARAVLVERSGLDLAQRTARELAITKSLAAMLEDVLDEPDMSVQNRRALAAAVHGLLADWAATGDQAAVPGLQRDLADLLRMGLAEPEVRPGAAPILPTEDEGAPEQANPDARERILREMLIAADLYGYTGMRLGVVQRHTGVSEETYEALFSDKETGFDAACAAAIERLRTALRAARPGPVDGDLRSRLETVFRAYLNILGSHGTEKRVLHSELPATAELRGRLRAMVAEYFVEAVEEIDPRTGRLLAGAVTGLVADRVAATHYIRVHPLSKADYESGALNPSDWDAPILAAWAEALLTRTAAEHDPRSAAPVEGRARPTPWSAHSAAKPGTVDPNVTPDGRDDGIPGDGIGARPDRFPESPWRRTNTGESDAGPRASAHDPGNSGRIGSVPRSNGEEPHTTRPSPGAARSQSDSPFAAPLDPRDGAEVVRRILAGPSVPVQWQSAAGVPDEVLLAAAADKTVDLAEIRRRWEQLVADYPRSGWRIGSGLLFRGDDRPLSVPSAEGFVPRSQRDGKVVYTTVRVERAGDYGESVMMDDKTAQWIMVHRIYVLDAPGGFGVVDEAGNVVSVHWPGGLHSNRVVGCFDIPADIWQRNFAALADVLPQYWRPNPGYRPPDTSSAHPHGDRNGPSSAIGNAPRDSNRTRDSESDIRDPAAGSRPAPADRIASGRPRDDEERPPDTPADADASLPEAQQSAAESQAFRRFRQAILVTLQTSGRAKAADPAVRALYRADPGQLEQGLAALPAVERQLLEVRYRDFVTRKEAGARLNLGMPTWAAEVRAAKHLARLLISIVGPEQAPPDGARTPDEPIPGLLPKEQYRALGEHTAKPEMPVAIAEALVAQAINKLSANSETLSGKNNDNVVVADSQYMVRFRKQRDGVSDKRFFVEHRALVALTERGEDTPRLFAVLDNVRMPDGTVRDDVQILGFDRDARLVAEEPEVPFDAVVTSVERLHSRTRREDRTDRAVFLRRRITAERDNYFRLSPSVRALLVRMGVTDDPFAPLYRSLPLLGSTHFSLIHTDLNLGNLLLFPADTGNPSDRVGMIDFELIDIGDPDFDWIRMVFFGWDRLPGDANVLRRKVAQLPPAVRRAYNYFFAVQRLFSDLGSLSDAAAAGTLGPEQIAFIAGDFTRAVQVVRRGMGWRGRIPVGKIFELLGVWDAHPAVSAETEPTQGTPRSTAIDRALPVTAESAEFALTRNFDYPDPAEVGPEVLRRWTHTLSDEQFREVASELRTLAVQLAETGTRELPAEAALAPVRGLLALMATYYTDMPDMVTQVADPDYTYLADPTYLNLVDDAAIMEIARRLTAWGESALILLACSEIVLDTLTERLSPWADPNPLIRFPQNIRIANMQFDRIAVAIHNAESARTRDSMAVLRREVRDTVDRAQAGWESRGILHWIDMAQGYLEVWADRPVDPTLSRARRRLLSRAPGSQSTAPESAAAQLAHALDLLTVATHMLVHRSDFEAGLDALEYTANTVDHIAASGTSADPLREAATTLHGIRDALADYARFTTDAPHRARFAHRHLANENGIRTALQKILDSMHSRAVGVGEPIDLAAALDLWAGRGSDFPGIDPHAVLPGGLGRRDIVFADDPRHTAHANRTPPGRVETPWTAATRPGPSTPEHRGPATGVRRVQAGPSRRIRGEDDRFAKTVDDSGNGPLIGARPTDADDHGTDPLPADPDLTPAEQRLAAEALTTLPAHLGPDADEHSLVQEVDDTDVVGASRAHTGKVARWWYAMSTGLPDRPDLPSLQSELGLSDRQYALLRVHPHAIGNADGIPFAVRDKANRLAIARDIQRFLDRLPAEVYRALEPEAARIARARALLSRAAADLRAKSADPILTRAEFDELRNLLSTRRQLRGIAADATQLTGQPPVQLLAYDATAHNGNGRVILAIGDADRAEIVSRVTNGLGSTVRTLHQRSHFTQSVYEISALRGNGASVVSIVDIGYRCPVDLSVASPQLAAAGGDIVARDITAFNATREFYAGQPDGPAVPRLRTALGHSYGSTTLCYAGQDRRLADEIDQAVLAGSPGTGRVMHHAREFGVPVYVLNEISDVVANLGAHKEGRKGLFVIAGLGINPAAAIFGAVPLTTAVPATGGFLMQGTGSAYRVLYRAHSSYHLWSDPAERVPGLGLDNLGWVVIGQPEKTERAEYTEVPRPLGKRWQRIREALANNETAVDPENPASLESAGKPGEPTRSDAENDGPIGARPQRRSERTGREMPGLPTAAPDGPGRRDAPSSSPWKVPTPTPAASNALPWTDLARRGRGRPRRSGEPWSER